MTKQLPAPLRTQTGKMVRWLQTPTPPAPIQVRPARPAQPVRPVERKNRSLEDLSPRLRTFLFCAGLTVVAALITVSIFTPLRAGILSAFAVKHLLKLVDYHQPNGKETL